MGAFNNLQILREESKYLTQKEILRDQKIKSFKKLCSIKKYLKINFDKFLNLVRNFKINLNYEVIKMLEKKQNASLILMLILIVKKALKIKNFKLWDLIGFGLSINRLKHGLNELKKLGLIILKGKYYFLKKNIVKNNGNKMRYLSFKNLEDWMIFFTGNFKALISVKKILWKKADSKKIKLLITSKFLEVSKYKTKFILLLVLVYFGLWRSAITLETKWVKKVGLRSLRYIEF